MWLASAGVRVLPRGSCHMSLVDSGMYRSLFSSDRT